MRLFLAISLGILVLSGCSTKQEPRSTYRVLGEIVILDTLLFGHITYNYKGAPHTFRKGSVTLVLESEEEQHLYIDGQEIDLDDDEEYVSLSLTEEEFHRLMDLAELVASSGKYWPDHFKQLFELGFWAVVHRVTGDNDLIRYKNKWFIWTLPNGVKFYFLEDKKYVTYQSA